MCRPPLVAVVTATFDVLISLLVPLCLTRLDTQVELLCSQRSLAVTARLMCWEEGKQEPAGGAMRRIEGVYKGLVAMVGW
jgi:hypothetical protein